MEKRKPKARLKPAEVGGKNLSGIDALVISDHYVIVLDRSATAKRFVAALGGKIRELESAIRASEKADWTHIAFIISKGHKGQYTAIAKDRDTFLSRAMPAVFEKLDSIGGTSAFLQAVEPATRDKITAMIALRQPVLGKNRH